MTEYKQDGQGYQQEHQLMPEGGSRGSREPEGRKDPYAVISLVMGLGSLVFAAPLTSILAIVFSVMSVKEHGKSPMATAGRVLGIVSASIIAAAAIFLLVCLNVVSQIP